MSTISGRLRYYVDYDMVKKAATYRAIFTPDPLALPDWVWPDPLPEFTGIGTDPIKAAQAAVAAYKASLT